MYGQGTAPPPPRPADRGTTVGLRVLFAVLPVVTLGIGAWGSMLRVALLRKRTLDWALMAAVGVIGISGFVLAGTAPDENTPQSNVGAVLLLLCMCATPVYFLIMDFLWADGTDRRARAMPPAHPTAHPNPYASGAVPGAMSGPAPGRITGAPGATGRPPYGYGQQQTPHPQTPQPSHPRSQPPRTATPQARPQQSAPPIPSAAPAPPAGPRIHQVRAELDELSDFLRKEEGR